MDHAEKSPPAQHLRAAAEHVSTRRSTAAFIDNRPGAAAQRKLLDAIEQSPRVAVQRRLIDSNNDSPRMAVQRAFIANIDASPYQVAQRQRHPSLADADTARPAPSPGAISSPAGLPDNLKAGMESLSGLSMNHVRVHYNSAQPVQLRALAYTQGSDVHVAPGQEKYLPHEAWHVVQQAQGRVQPTMQMKHGVAINDDAGLEHEADMMGAAALSTAVQRSLHRTKPDLSTSEDSRDAGETRRRSDDFESKTDLAPSRVAQAPDNAPLQGVFTAREGLLSPGEAWRRAHHSGIGFDAADFKRIAEDPFSMEDLDRYLEKCLRLFGWAQQPESERLPAPQNVNYSYGGLPNQTQEFHYTLPPPRRNQQPESQRLPWTWDVNYFQGSPPNQTPEFHQTLPPPRQTQQPESPRLPWPHNVNYFQGSLPNQTPEYHQTLPPIRLTQQPESPMLPWPHNVNYFQGGFPSQTPEYHQTLPTPRRTQQPESQTAEKGSGNTSGKRLHQGEEVRDPPTKKRRWQNENYPVAKLGESTNVYLLLNALDTQNISGYVGDYGPDDQSAVKEYLLALKHLVEGKVRVEMKELVEAKEPFEAQEFVETKEPFEAQDPVEAKAKSMLVFWHKDKVKSAPGKAFNYEGAKDTMIEFLAGQLHSKGRGQAGLADVFGGTGTVTLGTRYPGYRLSDYDARTMNTHYTSQSNPFKTDAIAIGAASARKADKPAKVSDKMLNHWRTKFAQKPPSNDPVKVLKEVLEERLVKIGTLEKENLAKQKNALSPQIRAEQTLLDLRLKGEESTRFLQSLLPFISGDVDRNTLKPERPEGNLREELRRQEGARGRPGQAAHFLAAKLDTSNKLEALREKLAAGNVTLATGGWQDQTDLSKRENEGGIPGSYDVYLDPPYLGFDWEKQRQQAATLSKGGVLEVPKDRELTGNYSKQAMQALDIPALVPRASELAAASKERSVFFSNYARLDLIQQSVVRGVQQLHLFPVHHYSVDNPEMLAIWNARTAEERSTAEELAPVVATSQSPATGREERARKIRHIRGIASEYVEKTAALLAGGNINRTAAEGKDGYIAVARRVLWRILRGTVQSSHKARPEPGAAKQDTFQRLHTYWTQQLLTDEHAPQPTSSPVDMGEKTQAQPLGLEKIEGMLKRRLELVSHFAAHLNNPQSNIENPQGLKEAFLATALDLEEHGQLQLLLKKIF